MNKLRHRVASSARGAVNLLPIIVINHHARNVLVCTDSPTAGCMSSYRIHIVAGDMRNSELAPSLVVFVSREHMIDRRVAGNYFLGKLLLVLSCRGLLVRKYISGRLSSR